MRKIFGAYRFHLLYDRLAGGFRNPDLGASLDYEIFSRISVVEERGGMLPQSISELYDFDPSAIDEPSASYVI